MNIEKRKNSKGDKVYFYIATGRKTGERVTTTIPDFLPPDAPANRLAILRGLH